MDKTHFRKAFNSPYLGSADIVDETMLTVAKVTLEKDQTKKTQDMFNTAYFVERELRPGEKLKPMILNATNSKTMHKITGSPYIDDWQNVNICVWVDKNVKMMGSTVEGLRIKAAPAKRVITPKTEKWWAQVVEAYKRDQNFTEILKHAVISEENQSLIMEQAYEAPQD